MKIRKKKGREKTLICARSKIMDQFSAKACGKGVRVSMVLPATVAMVTFPCCRAEAGTTIPWGLSVPVMAL